MMITKQGFTAEVQQVHWSVNIEKDHEVYLGVETWGTMVKTRAMLDCVGVNRFSENTKMSQTVKWEQVFSRVNTSQHEILLWEN